MRKSALALSLIASLGVIVLGVLQGIVIAIALAVVLYFHRGWQPHGAVLGRVDRLDGWHNVARYPDAREEPGVVVYRWEAPLFFANCAAFRTQVRDIVAERRVSWVVVQCEAITDIDVSAAQMLEQLDQELNAKGVHMAFVELRARLQDLVFRYGLYETLDRDRFYPTLDSCARRRSASMAERHPTPTRWRRDAAGDAGSEAPVHPDGATGAPRWRNGGIHRRRASCGPAPSTATHMTANESDPKASRSTSR